MKKIGLVGGTGPESTLMYYKELNSRIDTLSSGKEFPEIVIESVDLRKAWEYVSKAEYEKLTDYLSQKVNNLLICGAQVVSLTAGTMHIVYDDIEEKTHANLVSIPKTVSEYVVNQGIHKVGLLGTIFTMEKDFMKKDLVESGVEVFVPKKEDRELIAKRIYEELEEGIVKESTYQEFISIINQMKEEHGIEAIILGCTELPLLLNANNCPIPCLDAVEIHIQKLVNLAM